MGIRVEVAYATPELQKIIALDVSEGTTAVDAVKQSGIVKVFPQIELDNLKLGIFSKAVPLTQVLEAGDRVEIYRPLIADPKAMRKKRAEKAAQAKNED